MDCLKWIFPTQSSSKLIFHAKFDVPPISMYGEDSVGCRFDVRISEVRKWNPDLGRESLEWKFVPSELQSIFHRISQEGLCCFVVDCIIIIIIIQLGWVEILIHWDCDNCQPGTTRTRRRRRRTATAAATAATTIDDNPSEEVGGGREIQ